MTLGRHCSFVPPYLLERIAASDSQAADHCRETLAADQAFRAGRVAAPTTTTATTATGAAWVVHTAANGSTLPGSVVRTAGDPASGDTSVDEASDGITATLALYREAFARASYDGKGAEVVLTVHYQQNYDNAFWNGTQLVFGDGDGHVFGSFTKPVDVLGHEFTHAVTQFTADLTYQGQSGALNESVSDCFGMCVKQRVLGQTAETADWLVGEGIFLAGIHARALRDMAHPGTAYDDPTLGKDPQVGDMADYVETSDDNGGVHTNSGIPNRAFYLAATAIGGDTWEGAGQIWYAAPDRRAGHGRHRLRRLRDTSTGFYLPEIDGLRFFAISWVFIYHLNYYLIKNHPVDLTNIFQGIAGNGHLGVELFFVISGFVLSLPFARYYLKDGKKVYLKQYFIRRLTRLEPPYFLIMILLFFFLSATKLYTIKGISTTFNSVVIIPS